jgi:protein-tyrosine phosphatase
MLDSFAVAGGDAQSLADMIFVRAEYLDAAVTLMHRVHGGLDGYLRTALRIDEETLDRLRSRLLA